MTAWLTAGLTEAPALREKTDILAKKRFLKMVGPVTHEADRDSGEVGKGRPAWRPGGNRGSCPAHAGPRLLPHPTIWGIAQVSTNGDPPPECPDKLR